jgi:short-subunit dehydrogenase
LGTYYGIREFLPHLETRPDAGIVNISSLAGLVGLYGYAPYAVSKSAVRALTEVLQSEAGGRNLTILIVYPGGVKTNIIKNAPDLVEAQRETSHQLFTQNAWLTPDKAARKIVKAVRKRRKRLILGIDAKIVYAIRVLFPRRYPQILREVFSKMKFQ